MDYVVGSVAALISGNVTPNRPKLVKRALTPIKHQPSPNVTPKSEFVEDRSIFLSPTLQKKKAIVKKSPKRIFQNPDLDITSENENEGYKVDKVKKYLKDQLDTDESSVVGAESGKHDKSINIEEIIESNSSFKTPKKSKKREKSVNVSPLAENRHNEVDHNTQENRSDKKSKKKKSLNSDNNLETTSQSTDNNFDYNICNSAENTPKKKKKQKKSLNLLNDADNNTNQDEELNLASPDSISDQTTSSQSFGESKTSKKKNKRKSSESDQKFNDQSESLGHDNNTIPKKKKKVLNENKEDIKKSKKKTKINPNAVTNKDTDSEHESDNEIESENEEVNKDILEADPANDSSDEEEKPEQKTKVERKPATEDEIKRTLFVGNVPFDKKCKKNIRQIFNKHGTIETVRIRTVPVKDPSVTPKLAVIKNELHPECSTVNVYVKFKEASSVERALVENNTVLKGYHLRVSRSDVTGAEHDPKCTVFVGNVPFNLEDDVLRAKFEKCGEIVSVRIIRDRNTRVGKGFGYVNFANKDGVELALNLSEEDLTIKNRILRVKRIGQKSFKPHNSNSKPFQGKNVKREIGKPKNAAKEDGAYRRIMNKRKNEGVNEGSEKKDKKPRKEFVGTIADKKKKRKVFKQEKKKKVLSEILAKKGF